MTDTENVRNAANTMMEAARRMEMAAATIHDSLFRFLERFEQAVDKLAETEAGGGP